MEKIVFSHLMNKIFYVRTLYSVVCTVICIFTVNVTPYSSDIFSVEAYYIHPMHEITHLGIPK